MSSLGEPDLVSSSISLNWDVIIWIYFNIKNRAKKVLVYVVEVSEADDKHNDTNKGMAVQISSSIKGNRASEWCSF